MEVKEHFYADDPRRGPADGWTTLPRVDYFFIGNGLIQAAVQVCPSKKGTPVGLLIMDPERFGTKSQALSFDPVSGLRPTILEVETGGRVFSPHVGGFKARWVEQEKLPAVEVKWREGGLSITETFYCPDLGKPRLARAVTVRNRTKGSLRVNLRTGVKGITVARHSEIPGGKERQFCLEYRLAGKPGRRRVELAWTQQTRSALAARRVWALASRFRSSCALLDHLCAASLVQLPAIIAASGKLDGSIWQYNREWTRDQAMVATALTLSGRFELARTILLRLFSQFVTRAGDTVDSSQRRPVAECEVDQNGALLFALETYTLWSGDRTLLKRCWLKVAAAAEFPLKADFRHSPSGLLHNRREFWERHAAHGIGDGIELAHQLWVSMGLSAASRMALLLNRKKESDRWQKEAGKIKKAMLSDERFSLIHDGAFIKRRKSNGEVEEEVQPPPGTGLAEAVPLFSRGRHLLNPDTSTALPIAWEFIPPRCRLAARTLLRIEELWNQRWRGGGYGRYHVTSEPDSPGPWPFPSLFVARAYLEAGKDAHVWRVLRWLGRAAGARSGSWFEFYGPRPVPPYPQAGIVPWNWAEMIILFIHHLAGIRPEWTYLRVRPRLLAGVGGYDVDLRIRNSRIILRVRSAGRGIKPGFLVDGKSVPYSEEGLFLPYPRRAIRILARLPFQTEKTAR
jgi:hypothetical protein